MRVCPICRLAYRVNDPGGSCFVPRGNAHGVSHGTYAACSECCAQYTPGGGQYAHYTASFDTATVAEQTRLESDRCLSVAQLTGPDGRLPYCPAGLCGLCRKFAREDDRMQGMRLYREDFDSPEEAAKVILPQNEAEMYMVCKECRLKWAPRILARLNRRRAEQGFPPHEIKPEQMGEQMLG